MLLQSPQTSIENGSWNLELLKSIFERFSTVLFCPHSDLPSCERGSRQGENVCKIKMCMKWGCVYVLFSFSDEMRFQTNRPQSTRLQVAWQPSIETRESVRWINVYMRVIADLGFGVTAILCGRIISLLHNHLTMLVPKIKGDRLDGGLHDTVRSWVSIMYLQSPEPEAEAPDPLPALLWLQDADQNLHCEDSGKLLLYQPKKRFAFAKWFRAGFGVGHCIMARRFGDGFHLKIDLTEFDEGCGERRQMWKHVHWRTVFARARVFHLVIWA